KHVVEMPTETESRLMSKLFRLTLCCSATRIRPERRQSGLPASSPIHPDQIMCLAIPAQVSEILDADGHLALVDILGVRRKVNVDLLQDDPPLAGDWVLVHVGFAMSKISAQQAEEQLQMLTSLGEASTARDEADGYRFAEDT